MLSQTLDQSERLLQLFLVARVELDRVPLTLELLDQLMGLGGLSERDATKLLDILLALDVCLRDRHAFL